MSLTNSDSGLYASPINSDSSDAVAAFEARGASRARGSRADRAFDGAR